MSRYFLTVITVVALFAVNPPGGSVSIYGAKSIFNPFVHETVLPSVLERYVPAMLRAESDRRMYREDGSVVVSPAGAIGRWQVIPDTLGFYNVRMNRNYKVAQLSDPAVNERIGRWYLLYCANTCRTNVVITFNRYHQGHNAPRARLYYSYLKKICPDKLEAYMWDRQIVGRTKKGKMLWVDVVRKPGV
mgnify:CR=1 FL=1